MSELYNRINMLCERKGVSKAQMCRDTGISQGNITDLKMGRKASFSAKNMVKLADYFGVSVNYLLGTDLAAVTEQAMASQVDYSTERKENIHERSASLTVTPEEMSDLAETFNALRDRPEMKMLFKSAKGATKDQIEAVANMLESFKREE